MRTSRFSLDQKADIVRQHESGARVQKLCCTHGITPGTFYAWRKQLPEWEAERKREQERQALLR